MNCSNKIKSENVRFFDGYGPVAVFLRQNKAESRTDNIRLLPDILKSKAEIDSAIDLASMAPDLPE